MPRTEIGLLPEAAGNKFYLTADNTIEAEKPGEKDIGAFFEKLY